MNPSQNSTFLYGGAVKLDFETKGHRYTVTDEKGIRNVPSVTTILSVIDKSGPLTQWAANMTSEYIRAAVRPGLRYDEIQLGEIIESARFNFRRMSRQAKNVGQLAHEWVEGYLRNSLSAVRGQDAPMPINAAAANACQAAVAWIQQHFQPLCMEHRIYSRDNEFAGTIDVFGDVDGAPAIVDWKSAGAIYREFKLQTAAYAQAWAEMHDERVPDRWVIRLDKETGEFEAVKFPREEFKRDLAGFSAAKELHLTLESIKVPTAAKPPQIPPQPVQRAEVIPPAISQPRPMAPVPAQIPSMAAPITAPAARRAGRPEPQASPRIEGFAPAHNYKPRGRAKKPGDIFYQQTGESLILSGGTYPIRATLKQVFQASARKNGESWEWQIASQSWEALAGLCVKAGIRLIPMQRGAA